MNSEKFQLTPIGHIKTTQSGFSLQVESDYLAALEGMEEFGHVMVIWWNHLCDDSSARKELVCKQPYKRSPDQLGIYATRSPQRPNPLSISTVPIINVDHESGTIIIPFIDAENDSPIIDLKPYHPSLDRIKEVKVPQWCSHWPQWYEDSATFDWGAEFVNAT